MATELGSLHNSSGIFYLISFRCSIFDMLFNLEKNYFVLFTANSPNNTQLHSQDSSSYLDHSSNAFLNESTATNFKILMKYAN